MMTNGKKKTETKKDGYKVKEKEKGL